MDPLGLGLAVALFTLLGIATGTGTGLAPGIHVNNVAVLLLASRPAFEAAVLALFPAAGPEDLVAVLSSFVMGVVIGHSFLDFVPSVYLGAPDDRTALSVLPGHRMLRAGEGHLAVRLAAKGALAGVFVSLLLLVPLRLVLGPPLGGYERAKGAIAFILLGIAAVLILAERERRVRNRSGARRVVASRARQRAIALGLFLLAGGLGYVLLDTPWLTAWNWFPLGQRVSDFGSLVLFPLFTGLFGFPTLLLSSQGPTAIPPQDLGRRPVADRRGLARGIASGSVAGALVSWLPGLSSGAATALAQLLSRGRNEEPKAEANQEFMVALGAVGTATSLFTVAVLFIIDRARSGAAAAIQELASGQVTAWDPVTQPPALLVVLAASAALAAVVAYPVTVLCSRLAARHVHRVRYDMLARGVIVVLVAMIAVLAGAAGLMVATLAALLGLVPPLAGVKRVHLMGALVLPVVLLYLGLV